MRSISHLEQKQGSGSASKDQLMNGIEVGCGKFDDEDFKRLILIVAEESLKRSPGSREPLEDNLSRLGYALSENAVIPIEILDPSTLPELPSESHEDLTKAERRHFRNVWRIGFSDGRDLFRSRSQRSCNSQVPRTIQMRFEGKRDHSTNGATDARTRLEGRRRQAVP